MRNLSPGAIAQMHEQLDASMPSSLLENDERMGLSAKSTIDGGRFGHPATVYAPSSFIDETSGKELYTIYKVELPPFGSNRLVVQYEPNVKTSPSYRISTMIAEQCLHAGLHVCEFVVSLEAFRALRDLPHSEVTRRLKIWSKERSKNMAVDQER
ncbi:hypothetical protein BCR34DRAFT_594075 [Clohesyomyces aquaticus]|uniref:Uncharacterized protein n=1 Tax=Clohesyomyces aquaticus TaxID=1231657 RepID=A0A1Y1YD87_9PLEO|nr:hypothetical protein BCR34DRAFT_594075 [Clohesyomyces aquaticus]